MNDSIKDFHQQLEKVIATHETKYRAAQIIGAETDERLGTIHARLSKWDASKGLPESITKFLLDVDYLGFRVEIHPK